MADQESDWQSDFGRVARAPPQWQTKGRPVRIALLGDFSARAANGRLDIGADLGARKAIPVEFDSFEDALARLDVSLNLPIGESGSGVELQFADIDAFHPDELYGRLEIFSTLADLRKRLGNTATFAKAAAQMAALSGKKVRASRRVRGAKARGAALANNAKLDDFTRLLGRSAAPRPAIGVDQLLRDIVGPFVVPAADPKRDELIATVDKALSDAMRAVLHHPDFQMLESLWRGVEFLVRRLETGPLLQIQLYDVSAEEFASDLAAAEDLAETGLYRLLVEKPATEKNGGLALICGLYQFDATPPHAELLGRMAQVAAHAGAPFVTAITPDSFSDPRKALHPQVESAWAELRKLPEASRIAVAAPRFMLRYPYGARSDPITRFAFEEFTAQDGLSGMLWGHPALLVAAVLASPGKRPATTVGDLPFHYFIDAHGDQTALPCTERAYTNDQAAQMVRRGLIPVAGLRGYPEVRLAALHAVNGEPLALAGVHRPAEVRAEVLIGSAASASSATAATASTWNPDTSSSDSGSSWGSESSESSWSSDTSSESDPSSEPEMDPELAALLKS